MNDNPFDSSFQAKNEESLIDLPIQINIPQSLKDLDHWSIWEYNAEGNVRETPLLKPFEPCYQIASQLGVGIGLHLSADCHLTIIQIKNAIDPNTGKIDVEAFNLANALSSYAEFAHDGTTLTIIIGTNRPTDKTLKRVTILSCNGFIPITGNRFGEYLDVESRDIELMGALATLVKDSWLERYHQGLAHADSDTALSQLVNLALSTTDALQDAIETDLFEFLALGWSRPQIQNLVHLRLRELGLSFRHIDSILMAIEACVANPKTRETAPSQTDERISSDDWHDQLQYNAKRTKVLENFFNASAILQHHPEWQNRLSYETFRQTVTLDGKNPFDDVHEGRLIEWFGSNYEFSGSKQKDYSRAIFHCANLRPYDALLDFMQNLPTWDAKNRLRTWMSDCCGCEPNMLSAWIGYMTIMEMVARALNPGCMARQVPVWEGPENKGKTKLIKLLGHPWSITFDMSMDSKEAHMAVNGVWVAELAELDTIRSSRESRLKSFISQVDDTYIPKYSNRSVSVPRRCIFIGSTNEDDYLSSSTGNTRWYPIVVGKFDYRRLGNYRLQLFAEAKQLFVDNPAIEWWEEPESLVPILAEERAKRRPINPYLDKLREWLDGEAANSTWQTTTSWRQIAEQCLELQPYHWANKRIQGDVSAALKILGWQRAHNKKTSLWRRDEH